MFSVIVAIAEDDLGEISAGGAGKSDLDVWRVEKSGKRWWSG